MSFGYGVADLKGAVKSFKWMWENCFDKDGTADERYKRLKKSVKGLQDQVLRLQGVIERSSDPYYDPERTDYSDTRTEFKEVVGDFINTISQCYEILQDQNHIKLNRDPAGIIKNVIWGLTTQTKVESLIDQIQFHISRLQIILEPVKHEDLAIIRRTVLELLDRERRRDPELKAQASGLVPEWLEAEFEANFAVNAPLTVTNITEIGVKEGSDLLDRHFRSRNSHDPGLDARSRTIRRHLNILKCQWLVNTLRRARDFPSHHLGSAFPIFISNIEIKLYEELQAIIRTPGTSVDDEDLRRLLAKTKEPFYIWNPSSPQEPPSPTAKRPGEEHILTLPIASNFGPKADSELLVFRKGSTDFRLVSTNEGKGPRGFKSSSPLKEERFNLCIDKFVPRYTVEGIGVLRDSIPIELHLQGHTDPVTYRLKSIEDAWDFQRAITGYEVVGNKYSVRWTAQKEYQSIGYFLARSRREELQGSAQVWRWDPFSESTERLELDSRQSVDSPGSSESEKKNMAPSSLAPSQRSVNTFMTTETIVQGGVLEQTDSPKAPAIAFFGCTEKEYKCYMLRLRSDHFIDRSACRCTPATDGGTCRVLVIKRKSKSESNFYIQVLSTPRGGIKNWNLAVFRGPGGSAASNGPVETISCEKLQLAFQTTEDRRYLSDAFMVAMREYTEAMVEYRQYKGVLRHLGDRPRGQTRSVYRSPPSSVPSVWGAQVASGSYTSRVVADEPPRIASTAAISRFSLGLGLEEEEDEDEPPRIASTAAFSRFSLGLGLEEEEDEDEPAGSKLS